MSERLSNYNEYVRWLKQGWVSSPRGLEVHYRSNVSVYFHPNLYFHRTGDNPMIGIMEGLQCICGMSDPDQIARIAPKAKLELFTGMSMYGARIGDQLRWVVDELRADPHSRRAVITIADKHEFLEDRPCTNNIQFMMVDGSLHTLVNMRSSDAIWGLPYDMLQFTLIANVVNNCVCYGVGTPRITINIGHAHIYTETTPPDDVDFVARSFVIPYCNSELTPWIAWAYDRVNDITMEDFRTKWRYE